MRRESHERHRPSNGSPLSLATNHSSSTSSSRSSVAGSRSQHLIVQKPWRPKQGEIPHHDPDPSKDVERRVRVYSHRDKRPTEIKATFAHDLSGQCWISEEAVERLKLSRTPMVKDDWGTLKRRTFQSCGVVILEWIDDGRTKPTKCSIVPSDMGIEFGVIFESSMLPLAPAQERAMNIPRALSNYQPPSVVDSSPPTIVVPTDFAGSFDGEGIDEPAELMDDNSNEAKWADKWMSDLKLKVHGRKPQGFVRDKDSPPPVKIAVLDTGIDIQHNYIKGCKNANRIKGVKSFVTDDERTDDVCGHGTHVAALLLKVAPECQIYVAKVATGGKIPTDHSIAEALKWAINQEVDIISMSFGMDKDHVAMQEQILKAYSANIIMFAAASNRGQNYEVTFPARENEVICIYSTDGNGGKSHCNPTRLKNSGYHFATVGVAVKSAWPLNLALSPSILSISGRSMAGAAQQSSDRPAGAPKANKSPERRMTGTSFATPIVAAIAAFVLDFARMHGIGGELYQRLRCRKGMQEIFADHMIVENDKLLYIHPWKLFADYRSDEQILLLIKDTLARGIGGSQQAEIFDS